MQIVQATFGVFHQFELAQQLYKRDLLRKIYSTWPWARLRREGLPQEVVGTFPYFHTADYLLSGKSFYPRPLARKMKQWTSSTFDEWLLRVVPECDALIALSGAALKTGALVKRRGGRYVCDRGSSHHRFQLQILAEEHDRWGLPRLQEAPGVVERDEEIYALADAISLPSSFTVRSFVQMGVPAEKLHIIPYGVRLEHFRRTAPPPDIRERLEVIFAGQVSLRKGVPYLLEAFAKVRHPHKRLRIVGNAAPGFREFLERFPLESVEFVGSVPQPELAGIMGESHVLVLPSIEDGLALVMSQAMACGCPVIASTNTGGEDLFRDGEQGFIVPVRDSAALADRMQRLVDEPELQERLSQAALALTHAVGGWEQYGERWEALLHSLTGK